MKVFSRLTAVAAAVVFAAPMAMSAQALPKAEDLFAKHVAAIGGKDAIMQIKSMTQQGKIEIPAAGITGDLAIWMATPNLTTRKITLGGMGEIQQGYDGKVAWEISPMTGTRLLADKELTAAQEQADFIAQALYSPTRFTSAETVGDTTFNGEKAYKVKTVSKSGRETSIFFSAASGLELGTISTVDSPMGSMTVTSTESDYKQFGPLKFATRSEQMSGPQKFILTISNVTYGDAAPSMFELPAAVKALVKP